MRGNLGGAVGAADDRGSIPACAGEPRLTAQRPRKALVYPRVCGGTSRDWRRRKCPAGLSPRVRGNLANWPAGDYVRRSIPACAGEPSIPAALPPGREVYPRVCGGTQLRGGRLGQSIGLSPRVRGNRHLRSPLMNAERSIPACAGEPLGACPQRPGHAVYPRVCGGTWWAWAGRWWWSGLSPRVRGNRR